MSHEAIIINIVRVKAVYQSVEVKCVNDGATRQTVDCSCEKNSAVKKMYNIITQLKRWSYLISIERSW